ncbi:MAG: HupE/UreJ family protein [Methylococcaceae bacterium]|nr:HupE/UreJ family protein [Methylococcaceae bacterium]
MMIRIIGLIFLCLQLHTGLAHPPGLSSADLTVKPDSLVIKFTYSSQDIEALVPMDTDGDAEVSDDELGNATSAVSRLVSGQFKMHVDGKEIKNAFSNTVSFDNKNNTHVTLNFPVQQIHTLGIDSKILSKLPTDHKQYLTIKDVNGKEIGNKMLTQKDSVFEFDLQNVSATAAETADKQANSTFIDFLKLGIEHILTGYDHLLFLFSLLVITRSFWPAIQIITFFTIAHSITLALAGMAIVDFPSSIIEPLIAATIVYVGLENIFRKDHVTTKQRCVLTFFFGLIHGFGFAGVLREMGISSIETGILVPLFSFNLGVELGQIAVASIVLPIIWQLHKQEKIDRYLVPIGSVLTCLAGGYWLLERTVLS